MPFVRNTTLAGGQLEKLGVLGEGGSLSRGRDGVAAEGGDEEKGGE